MPMGGIANNVDSDMTPDDQAIIAAVRRRLLQEIENKGQTSSIINNVYGTGRDPEAGAGDVRGMMLGGEDPFDYMVDIERRDLPDINPETGKPMGWTKKVRRYREKKE